MKHQNATMWQVLSSSKCQSMTLVAVWEKPWCQQPQQQRCPHNIHTNPEVCSLALLLIKVEMSVIFDGKWKVRRILLHHKTSRYLPSFIPDISLMLGGLVLQPSSEICAWSLLKITNAVSSWWGGGERQLRWMLHALFMRHCCMSSLGKVIRKGLFGYYKLGMHAKVLCNMAKSWISWDQDQCNLVDGERALHLWT